LLEKAGISPEKAGILRLARMGWWRAVFWKWPGDSLREEMKIPPPKIPVFSWFLIVVLLLCEGRQ